jgi:hypothetical protein
MTLRELSALIGPPPGQPFPVDWATVEAWLGVGLPTDYRAFAEAYGPTLVGGWLWVWVPHADDRGGYPEVVTERHGWLRSLRDNDPRTHPYAVHPEPGGLLVWGNTRGGEIFYWDTGSAPDPDRWVTRIYRPDADPADRWIESPLPATGVMAAAPPGAGRGGQAGQGSSQAGQGSSQAGQGSQRRADRPGRGGRNRRNRRADRPGRHGRDGRDRRDRRGRRSGQDRRGRRGGRDGRAD